MSIVEAPTTLAGLIGWVESGDHLDSIHFDPRYKPDLRAYPICIDANHCNATTADVLCATSWGLYQIEGDSLYLYCAWKYSIAAFLASSGSQLGAFLQFITRRGINYSLDDVLNDEAKRKNFAHHYNGDADAYSERMVEVYAKLKDGRVP